MPQHPFEVDQRGMTLRGAVYRPDGPGRFPALLMLHGFTGQRSEAGFLFVELARRLVERGVAAVTFDFMHSGESDGAFERMLVTGEVDDALRMTQWLVGQPFVDRSRLGLLGFSLGGLVAACVLGRTQAYKAGVLLAPTTVDNLARYARREAVGDHITVGPHRLHPDFFTDMLQLNPVADVVRHPRPILLVQGEGDESVPPRVSQAYIDQMRRLDAPVTVERIPDSDHIFNRPHWRRRCVDRTVDWVSGAL